MDDLDFKIHTFSSFYSYTLISILMVGSSLLQLDGMPRNRDSGSHGWPLERAQTLATVDEKE
jgi:hypothetical protein